MYLIVIKTGSSHQQRQFIGAIGSRSEAQQSTGSSVAAASTFSRLVHFLRLFRLSPAW